MNAALSAIAASEADPRFMPPPPTAHHDHGAGLVEAVPLVSRTFLQKCGTTALYIVLQEMDERGRFEAETKEELVELIITAASVSDPRGMWHLVPVTVPRFPLTAREKRRRRSIKRQIREARREARQTHGSN